MPKIKEPSNKPWLAYMVQEDHEGTAIIVYAQHRATAQNHGSCHLNADFQDVHCHRTPQWDSYYPHGPDDLDLYNAGWWMPCQLCYHGRVEKDCGGHEIDGHFYCQKCYDGFTTMRPIHHPKASEQAIGEPYTYDFLTEEMIPNPFPLSAYPLLSHRVRNPYFWYSPFS